MRVGDLVGHPVPTRRFGASTKLVANDVFLGLELELEGLGKLHPQSHSELMASGLWEIVPDQSLRNGGQEFIMKERGTNQPLLGADVIAALDAFEVFIERQTEAMGAPEVSRRTSTHLHIDVRDLTVDELTRFMLLYYTFENILFKWVGGERRTSPYCRPASDHNDIIYRAARMFAGSTKDKVHVEYGNKYDALNYLSVRNIGTVEIRMMRGCFDKEQLITWINILLSLRAACRDETLEIDSFPERASHDGMEQFLTGIFKDYSGELLRHTTGMEILEGVRLAQEVLVLAEAIKRGNKAKPKFDLEGVKSPLLDNFLAKLQ